MNLCSCKPFVRRNVDVRSEPYESSYNRSYFYENAVYHPFIHARSQRKIVNDDSNLPISSVASKKLETVSKITFVPKYWEHCNSGDFFRRSSSVSKSTLKTLHEKSIADPPRPIEWGSTTTGSTYVQPTKWREPETWSRASPIEEFTFPIYSSCKEGLPTFLPNERGSIKHVDPYLTSSQSVHCNFSEDQQNGVARKNILTFYDTIGLAKNRGFGPKKLEPFGSFFHREKIAPYRVQAKPEARVPFSGCRSTYGDGYGFVPNRVGDREEGIGFPAVCRSTESTSYCTEQCHVGTGWPVRGTVDIGTVRGTY